MSRDPVANSSQSASGCGCGDPNCDVTPVPAESTLDATRAQNCRSVYAYAVTSGDIKLVLGHPVLGAVGIDWALTTAEARKLRDDLTRALDA